VRTDAQKTIHGPLITRPQPCGITGKYGNLPKVALPDDHNNAVSRAKSRPLARRRRNDLHLSLIEQRALSAAFNRRRCSEVFGR